MRKSEATEIFETLGVLYDKAGNLTRDGQIAAGHYEVDTMTSVERTGHPVDPSGLNQLRNRLEEGRVADVDLARQAAEVEAPIRNEIEPTDSARRKLRVGKRAAQASTRLIARQLER